MKKSKQPMREETYSAIVVGGLVLYIVVNVILLIIAATFAVGGVPPITWFLLAVTDVGGVVATTAFIELNKEPANIFVQRATIVFVVLVGLTFTVIHLIAAYQPTMTRWISVGVPGMFFLALLATYLFAKNHAKQRVTGNNS